MPCKRRVALNDDDEYNREMAKCDFCSDPQVVRIYPCPDFVLKNVVAPGIDFYSRGEWHACSACSDLIEQDDWDGLFRRVDEILIMPCKEKVRPGLREQLRLAHSRFRELRQKD